MNGRDIGNVFAAIILVILIGIGISYMYSGGSETVPEEPTPQQNTEKVTLYYPNQTLAGQEVDPCGADVLGGVETEVAKNPSALENAIIALISEPLPEQAKEAGFSSEFPNKDFELINTETSSSTAILTFTEVPGFTSGGSCRINLLREQIKQTATQFDDIDRVEFKPETIFQP